MGYYSQVSYAVEFPNEEHLKNFVATFRCIPELKEALDDTRVAQQILFMDKDSVKWYDEFKDVKAHQRLIQEANDLGYATCFIRIGEEDGDIERDDQDGEHEDYGDTIVCGSDLLNIQMAIAKDFETKDAVTVDTLLQGETR